MENKEIQLNSYHCFYYIFRCFAYYTDGEIVENENNTLLTILNRWIGNDEELTTKTVNETNRWIEMQGEISNKEAINIMGNMVGYLASNDKFDTLNREHFLLDIRTISRSDGDFCEKERVWHDIMAEQLNISIRVSESSVNQISHQSQQIQRRPIGFTASR